MNFYYVLTAYLLLGSIAGAFVALGWQAAVQRLKIDFITIERLWDYSGNPRPRWRYRLSKPFMGRCTVCMSSAWGLITYAPFAAAMALEQWGRAWVVVLYLPAYMLLMAFWLNHYDEFVKRKKIMNGPEA